MVAGKSRADTVVMRALPRQVFMKTGAEGVYCGAFPELGLGFALKVQDGAKRAAAGAAMALVERLYPVARGLMPVRRDQDVARAGGGRRALLGRVRRRARRPQSVNCARPAGCRRSTAVCRCCRRAPARGRSGSPCASMARMAPSVAPDTMLFDEQAGAGARVGRDEDADARRRAPGCRWRRPRACTAPSR